MAALTSRRRFLGLTAAAGVAAVLGVPLLKREASLAQSASALMPSRLVLLPVPPITWVPVYPKWSGVWPIGLSWISAKVVSGFSLLASTANGWYAAGLSSLWTWVR